LLYLGSLIRFLIQIKKLAEFVQKYKDFFLWGYMQSLVYETPVETQHDLVARTAVATGTIRELRGI
jgi:hypothetical protein